MWLYIFIELCRGVKAASSQQKYDSSPVQILKNCTSRLFLKQWVDPGSVLVSSKSESRCKNDRSDCCRALVSFEKPWPLPGPWAWRCQPLLYRKMWAFCLVLSLFAAGRSLTLMFELYLLSCAQTFLTFCAKKKKKTSFHRHVGLQSPQNK